MPPRKRCVFPTMTRIGRAYEDQVRQAFASTDALFIDLGALVRNLRGYRVVLGRALGTKMRDAVVKCGATDIDFTIGEAQKVDGWGMHIDNAEEDLALVGTGPLALKSVLRNIEALAGLSGRARFHLFDKASASFSAIDAADIFPHDCSMILAEVCHPMELLPLKVLQLERDLVVLQEAANLATGPSVVSVFIGDASAAASVQNATGCTSLLWFDGPGNDVDALKHLGDVLRELGPHRLRVLDHRLVAVYIPFIPVACALGEIKKEVHGVKEELREVKEEVREVNTRMDRIEGLLHQLVASKR